jgi:hypothetical protein
MNYKKCYEKLKELVDYYRTWATVKSQSDMKIIGRFESELLALESELEGMTAERLKKLFDEITKCKSCGKEMELKDKPEYVCKNPDCELCLNHKIQQIGNCLPEFYPQRNTIAQRLFELINSNESSELLMMIDRAIEEYSKLCQPKREWISVKDKLPDQEITFIACDNTGDIFPAELAIGSCDKIFDLEAQCYLPPHQFLTHWMPLPLAPKDEIK